MEKFYNVEEQRFWNEQSNWSSGGHEWSAHFGTTEKLWNEHLFSHLIPFRGKKILEIAPGHGRITQFLAILAGELQVVDLNENCIEETKKKLGTFVEKYHTNDGRSLTSLEDEYFDLVFSFDSFVHMHANVIEAYIKEINRVLKPGGYGLIHHSYLQGGKDESFQNKAGRSNMTPDIFKGFVESNGMQILLQKDIMFPTVMDTISLFIKL
jgi:ubiquinone/menaquinone biosynthesis C-methylase UbiE